MLCSGTDVYSAPPEGVGEWSVYCIQSQSMSTSCCYGFAHAVVPLTIPATSCYRLTPPHLTRKSLTTKSLDLFSSAICVWRGGGSTANNSNNLSPIHNYNMIMDQ